MERARDVRVAVRPAIAEIALEVGVVEDEDNEANEEHQHDNESKAAADQHRRQRGALSRGRLGADRPPGRPVPVLKPVV